ncbi:MAG: DUF4258 domain-containing protein [Myxococcota bacterium]
MARRRYSKAQAEAIIRANADCFWLAEPHGSDAMRGASLDEWDVVDALTTGDVFRSRSSDRWCVDGADKIIVVVEIEASDHLTVVTVYRPWGERHEVQQLWK